MMCSTIQTINFKRLKSMSKMPFIIKTHIVGPTVPKQSETFDPSQQSKIQVLQAMNGYLTINMVIQAVKIFWSFWHYESECPSFSYLSLGFMCVNIIWALISYFGFRSIRNKNSRHLRIFLYLVIANFFIRIAMYIACGTVMNSQAFSSYMPVSTEELQNRICAALYPQTLYVITGIFEALISILVVILLRGVIGYIEKWENSETNRIMEMQSYKKDSTF